MRLRDQGDGLERQQGVEETRERQFEQSFLYDDDSDPHRARYQKPGIPLERVFCLDLSEGGGS